VRRGVLALSLLAVLLLAACGSGAESEWPGPPKAHADGSVSVKGFNDYLDEYQDYSESPEALATEFLRLDEQRGATTSLVTTEAAEGADRATAVATLAGIADDSVEAVRYVLVVTKEKDGWRLESAVRTQRCRSGRGHADFSAAACV
jgi:hypothetical protein